MKKDLIQLLKDYNSKEDGIYIPIDIEKYVEKLLKNATIVPYIEDNTIQAFIAYYKNDSLFESSFLTMLLVSKNMQGKGLGRILLEFSIKDIEKNGFQKYFLEVLKDNIKAQKLYESYGFIITEDRGELWLMEKVLK